MSQNTSGHVIISGCHPCRHRSLSWSCGPIFFSQNVSIFCLVLARKVCERALEEEGVYGDIEIGEAAIDFFPLEVR